MLLPSPFLIIIFAEIAVGVWFVNWLLKHDYGPKEPRFGLAMAMVFGAVAIPIAIFLEYHFLPSSFGEDVILRHRLPASTLFGYSLIVGVIEELAKALPLAFFIYKRRYFNELTDGIIYFCLAAIVFGIAEDISYTVQFGPATGVARILSGPFAHAGFTVFVGWFLARAKVLHKSLLWVVLGIAIAIGLHSLFDFGLFVGKGWTILGSYAITIFVNLNIFWLFKRAQKGDEKLGLSAVGKNLYCRNCGYPNPRRYMYCVNCGQKA